MPIIGDVKQQAARTAEELGLDSVWSTDHLIGRSAMPILESTTVLGAAAGATERIRIGFGVLLQQRRPARSPGPQKLSGSSTLQHISGDRLEVGVGTGNPAHGDIGWRAAGQSPTPDTAAGGTDESLRLLP